MGREFGGEWIHVYVEASQVELMVKNPPDISGDARTLGLIPGLGRCPGGGNDNPLQYSYMENSMHRGAWWAIAHMVTKSQTQLSNNKPLFY